MTISFIRPPRDDPPFCWLFESPSQKIGVHLSKGWCASIREEAPIYFVTEDKCIGLFILLDLNKAELRTFLSEAACNAPQYGESIRSLPISLMLKSIFRTSYSDYWPAKALDWLEDAPELLPAFVDELEYMVSHKVMSQALRHRARRMLRSVAPRELAPH